MENPLHPQELSGVLVVDKPVGMISKDVSRWLTKKIGSKLKMGHAGTLDPAADGVLPILLGKATRLQDLMLDLPKTYECQMCLGYETDSLDLDGEVIKEMHLAEISKQQLEKASKSLLGSQRQVPPIYSAVKYRGKPLYSYARSGRAAEIDLESLARYVEIYEFKILEFSGQIVTFRLRCSKGTYVRVAAKALAEKLGTCGTVTKLSRMESSGLERAQAASLEEIDKFLEKTGKLRDPLLIPIEKLDLGLESLAIEDPRSVTRLLSGQKVYLEKGLPEVRGSKIANLIGKQPQDKILLLDNYGRVFGLGARQQRSGVLQVEMKRSLL